MTMVDRQELLNRLNRYGQQRLARFCNDLDEASYTRLAPQIANVDLEQLTRLCEAVVEKEDWAELARRAEPPPALRLNSRRGHHESEFGWTAKQARQRGEQALDEGKVGVLMTAGGQGSRLGFDRPKGLYPIGPVSGASLLQIHIEKIRAAARRHQKSIPLYLMNSPVTAEEQSAFLSENDYFGMTEKDIFLFCQGTMPVVDAVTGDLLLATKDTLFLSPDGHGGTVAALATSGAIESMRERGIEQLFYFQVDNPLVPICDAEFIGHHLKANSELTSMAVAKKQSTDKVGNFVQIDRRLQIIEYSDFPADVAAQRAEDGALQFWAGSIAVHMFSVDFLERSLSLSGALPFHAARKKVAHLGEEGKVVQPNQPNALKFERFIFDLLPHAQNALVVEYAEEDCFAPLKNAPGAERDTAEYVQRFMIHQYHRWLQEAGIQVARDVAVEISPLWAFDEREVARRATPGTAINQTTYLCEDVPRSS